METLADTPLWLALAIPIVMLAVEIVKVLVVRRVGWLASDWTPRVLALLVPAVAAIAGALPPESAAGQIVGVIATGLGSIGAWHVANRTGLLNGETTRKLLPVLLAAFFAWPVQGCAGAGMPPDEPLTEWLGERFDATGEGHLHLVGGEWHGEGSLRATFEAYWRIWKVQCEAQVSVLLDRDGLVIGQRLVHDVAGVVQPEQDLVCLVYPTGGDGLQVECRICGRVGSTEICRPFGVAREVPLLELDELLQRADE